jgi:hypothetical protein
VKNTYHNLEGFKRKSLQMGSVLGIPIRDQFKDIVDAVRVSRNAARRAKRNAARRWTIYQINRKALRCLGVARLELLYRITVVAYECNISGFRKCQMTIK